MLLSGRVASFGALLTTELSLPLDDWLVTDGQRLRCFQLLRLLQGFLGHFVSPSFDLPCWASSYLYAKQSPNLKADSPIRNLLNL
jgi:hypothetical protein